MMLLVLVLLVTGGQARRGRTGEAREVRAVVPQLLPNYTASTLPPAHQVRGVNRASNEGPHQLEALSMIANLR